MQKLFYRNRFCWGSQLNWICLQHMQKSLALVGNAINFDTQKFVILTTAVNFDNLELMKIIEKKSSNPNNILRYSSYLDVKSS